MSAKETSLNEKLPNAEASQIKPPKKRTKLDKAKEDDDSEKWSDEDEQEDDNQAVTKFKNLKPGRYYKVVSLGKGRQRNRIVAVPVSDIEVLNRQLMKNTN